MTARPPASAFSNAAMLSTEALAVVSGLHRAGAWSPTARLRLDSRLVRPGDVFVAAPGGAIDGRQFIVDAIRAGARAVLWDPADGFCWPAQAVAQLASPWPEVLQMTDFSEQNRVTQPHSFVCNR